jgi:biotin carboxyl carrier protein
MDHASHEVVVEADPLQRGEYGVLIEGTRYEVTVQDERVRRLAAATRPPQAGGEVTVRAPIPGLVIKVLVAAGQEVVEGESLLILEAMKMENELRTPRAGVVHEVRVAPGAQVAHGQVLVTIRAGEG